jgi:hypothetical protein
MRGGHCDMRWTPTLGVGIADMQEDQYLDVSTCSDMSFLLTIVKRS